VRIIAGAARGRTLAVPSHGTRPTPDRVREAMFSTLQSMLAGEDRTWSELHVIDAYAGSGALGLEALSRGAASVLLVEKRAAAAQVIRRNIARVGLPGARVAVTTAASLARRTPDGPPADLIVLDPPYEVLSATIGDELTALVAAGWVAPDAIVVVERPASATQPPMPWPAERREYGDTALWYGRVAVEREERDGA
jgi:16S rRNA (guanine966-N2)-methyltransferase